MDRNEIIDMLKRCVEKSIFPALGADLRKDQSDVLDIDLFLAALEEEYIGIAITTPNT